MKSGSKFNPMSFLLNHGEKLVVGIFVALACGLVLAGLDAVRSKGATPGELPDVLTSKADTADKHVDAEKNVPAKMLSKVDDLSQTISAWRKPEIAAASLVTSFDKPLREESTKRIRPQILPLEKIHAVAGFVVIAAKTQNAGMTDLMENPSPSGGQDDSRPTRSTKPDPKPKKKPASDKDSGPGMTPPGMMAPGMMGPGMMPSGQIGGAKGIIKPYVMVTGLIPFTAQINQYIDCFSTASFQDPRRDIPMWSDYRIQRSLVQPGREPAERDWKTIDFESVAKQAKDWSGVSVTLLDPKYIPATASSGGPSQQRVFPLVMPLPSLANEPWGLNALHPWFQTAIKESLEFRIKKIKSQSDSGANSDLAFGGQSGGGFPGMSSGGNGPPSGSSFGSGSAMQGSSGYPSDGGGSSGGMMPPGGMMNSGGMSGDSGAGFAPVEYQLFRFADFDVQPGQSYRYRVELRLWNPNFEVEASHLVSPDIADDPKLTSPFSEVTVSVQVSKPVTMLVRALEKSDMKRVKTGTFELAILGEDKKTGNLSLRSLVAELGSLANIDKSSVKANDTRFLGQDIETDSILIDTNGKQDVGGDAAAASKKLKIPPEPFEMLLLDSSGELNVISLADSERLVMQWKATLPTDPKATDKPAALGLPGSSGSSSGGSGSSSFPNSQSK